MVRGIWLGDTEGADFKVGAAQVQKIMVGNAQVWPPIVLTAFNMASAAIEEELVCDQTADTVYYHNGSNAAPTINDTVYDSGGTPVVGGIDFFKTDAGYIQINASGVVVDKGLCAKPVSLSNGNSTSFGACQLTTNNSRWHNGASLLPGLDDTIFTDDQLSQPLIGGNQWYQTSAGTTIVVGNDGVVTNTGVC